MKFRQIDEFSRRFIVISEIGDELAEGLSQFGEEELSAVNARRSVHRRLRDWMVLLQR
jgi:hypothetical protein